METEEEVDAQRQTEEWEEAVWRQKWRPLRDREGHKETEAEQSSPSSGGRLLAL